MELLGFIGFGAILVALAWLLGGLLKGAERDFPDSGGADCGVSDTVYTDW